MLRLIALYLILSMLAPTRGQAQPLRFGSGVFAGGTLAQVDGDDMQGYDKPGIEFGLRGIAFIIPKFEFHTELSYSQRGSQSKGYGKSTNNGRKMILDYGCITGLLVVNDWYHPLKEYYRLQLEGGVSMGRLIRSEIQDPIGSGVRSLNLNEINPYISTNDLSMVLGANIKLTRKSGITFRYHRSMSKILDAEKVQPFFEKRNIISMKGYFLSLDAFYHF